MYPIARNFVYSLGFLALGALVVGKYNTQLFSIHPVFAAIMVMFWFTICAITLALGMQLVLEIRNETD